MQWITTILMFQPAPTALDKYVGWGWAGVAVVLAIVVFYLLKWMDTKKSDKREEKLVDALISSNAANVVAFTKLAEALGGLQRSVEILATKQTEIAAAQNFIAQRINQ